jgi:hypothetical protein
LFLYLLSVYLLKTTANMKLLSVAATLLPALASAAMFTKEEYDSGEVMSLMMEAKEVSIESEERVLKLHANEMTSLLGLLTALPATTTTRSGRVSRASARRRTRSPAVVARSRL